MKERIWRRSAYARRNHKPEEDARVAVAAWAFVVVASVAVAESLQKRTGFRVPAIPRPCLNWCDHANRSVREGTFCRKYRPPLDLPWSDRSKFANELRSSKVTIATAIAGGSIGIGYYVAVRLFSQARSMGSRSKGEQEKSGEEHGTNGSKKEFPMLDMAEIARRAVPRKKSFLYTRRGDKGTSQLYNMETRPKSDPAFEALGNMDELNASLALAAEHSALAGNGLYEMIVTIESLIIDASALVATPRDSSSARKINRTDFPTWCTEQLEAFIDELDSRTPPLKTFVIPGGGLAASHLHVARCVCRRAERSLQPLLGTGQGVEEVARFVNRLSDLLFAAARYASMADGKPERPWKKLPAQEEKAEEKEEEETPGSNGLKH